MKPSFFHIMALCSLLIVSSRSMGQTEVSTGEVNSEMYGNPYLIRDWSNGIVKFTSGRVVNQFKLRFDCVRNQLLLQFQGSTFAAESKVREFVMYTNKKKDSLVFRKGYPATGKATENTFYQVLLEGKTQLLKLVSKNIIEEREMIASSRKHGRLEDEEKYYLFRDGAMILLPPERELILAALPEKATALSAFITENNLRFKSEADYIQLATKYNELQ